MLGQTVDDGSTGEETSPGPGESAAHAALRVEIAGLLPDLRGFARFLARDRVQADDLVQDALMHALAALEQFQPGTNLKAWLFTILRNGFYQHIRRHKREQGALSTLQPGELSAPSVQEDVSAVRDLTRMIWTLPPLLREALILVGAQEMSYDEAALVCGVPVGTMKARVSRGRTALAASVRRAEEGAA